MNPITILTLIMATVFILPSTGLVSAEEPPQDQLLIDYGNGTYEWNEMNQESGITLISAISYTLNENEIEFTATDILFVSVKGIFNITVGDQKCEWRIFIWDSYAWVYGGIDGTEIYSGGTVALVFSPSSTILPTATPLFPETWTSYRGDSSASGISTSTDPERGASPLEWSVTSTSGGVYGTVLYADGLSYYVTAGDFYGSGVDRNPHLLCVDTVNHDKLWTFTYSVDMSRNSEQNEITTPIIVGDMIIITSANRHIYCLDRYEGEVLYEMLPDGDDPHYASSFNSTIYSYETTTDGTWTMEGQIFANGPTTATYDSGALYFNTHDGRMHCYSIDRERGFEKLWSYIPEKSERGCFYFNPPVITKIDDRRVVLSGSYSGRLYCMDALTGDMISITRIADLGSYGTGVVSGITPAGNATAVITCDDGRMSPINGFTSLIDLHNLSEIWRVDLFSSSPVVVGNTVYAYMKPSVDSGEKVQIKDKNENSSDAYSGYYALSLTDGHKIWCNQNDAYTKSGMVYCDGSLYCADYGTLNEWPVGGALRCIDPDTGNIIWSVKLAPGSANGYCMSTPTIVGGKIYVGNDDGTLYCISDVPGIKVTETSSINYVSEGLVHWSWIILYIVAGVTTLVAVAVYRM